MKKIVLLTGASGYLGGRIASSLANEGKFNLRLAWLGRKPAVPGKHSLLRLDILSGTDLRRVCRGVNCIVHLAALNEIDSARDPETAFLVNSLGTLRLLRAAGESGVKRFIYFSTAHVYGTPLAGTISEKTLPRPAHPYAITHKAAEDFVLAARDSGRIDGIVLRLSNGIGAPTDPRVERWTLIGNDLCRQAVSTGKLVLKTAGLQKRDFVPLSDVCRAVSHFIELDREKCGDGLFNLGGKRSISVFETAKIVAARCRRVLGFEPAIARPFPARGDKAGRLDYRVDKLMRTGFRLTGTVEEEIDMTISLCTEAFIRK